MDKSSDFMKSTLFKVEDVFGGNLKKDSILPEQITKPNDILVKLM